jgi:hypothetical protein
VSGRLTLVPGAHITVRLRPRARRNAIEGERDGVLRVEGLAPAKLRRALGLPPN